jgi:flagellar biosynthesis protein FlhA
VLRVMRNLLKEGVSIRDLRSILEALTEIAPSTRDPEQLTEMTRQRLSRQITAQFTGHDGTLSALVLDAPVEEMFRRSLREIATGTGGALDPELARQLGVALEAAVKRMAQAGRPACVVVAPDVRRYLRAFAERRCPRWPCCLSASWSRTLPSGRSKPLVSGRPPHERALGLL